MKILFTGGGTGGHFYPIIAVAESIIEIVNEKKLLEPEMYFLAPDPYNEKILFDHKIYYEPVPAGKIRRYFSILNFFDVFTTFFGILIAFWRVFWIYPDVIFSKGGYGSFPVVLAGKFLGIPIIIHESDSAPGKANEWASKFAKKIAISYPEAANFFDKEKVAWTGNPVRKEISLISKEGAKQFLDLKEEIKTIFILGGSQGAELINELIIDALPELIKDYQIIHQVGPKNYTEVSETTNMILENSEFKNRYKIYGYLDDLGMRMSAGAADLIISRAGSTIFEIALWQVPSILIPITNSNANHQRKNAYTYARNGGAVVIEEPNLNKHILISEINRIFGDEILYKSMIDGAKKFAKPEASKHIADEIIDLVLKHEK